MRRTCLDSDMPLERTVRRWYIENPEFASEYTRAKEAGIEALVDETLDISDDGTNDWMEAHGQDDVGYKLNGEHVQRSKIRIETRRWLAERMMPKKFGVRAGVDVTSSDGSLTVDADARAKRLAALMAQAQARKDSAEGEPSIDDLV